MSRIKTFVDGGNLLPSDLDSIQDDYEVAFGTYKPLKSAAIALTGSPAGPYQMSSQVAFLTSLQGVGQYTSIYLDPAMFWSDASTSAANPRTVYYNLRAFVQVTTATAPGTAFTVSLVQGGTTTTVAGSSVTLASPPASSFNTPVSSGDFAAPAASFYVLETNIAASMAAGSTAYVVAELFMRQI